MPLSWNEIKNRAIAFQKEWEGETSEKAESQFFWNDFFNVFGISRRRVASFEQPIKKADNKQGFIDLLWKGTILVILGNPPYNAFAGTSPAEEAGLVEVQFQPDDTLYYRLFAELFLFLKQYQPPHPWQIVVIYPHCGVEREQSLHFGEILNLSSVRRIYLDELAPRDNPSLGIGVIKLVVESETAAVRTAQTLIERTREEITDQSGQRQLINLIESIIIYKLPQKSREEIEAMFELNAAGETTSDLLANLIEALKEAPDSNFQRWLSNQVDLWSMRKFSYSSLWLARSLVGLAC